MINNHDKSAIKAGVANFFGSFFVKAISFLTVPIFTNLLSPGEFGEVSIFQTYLSIGIIVICFHFDSALQIGKIDYGDDFDKYASTMVKISLVIFSFVFLFSLFNYDFLAKILGLQSKYVLFLVFFSFQDFIISYFIMYNITQLKYKMNLFISIFNVIGSILLSLFFVLYLFDFDKGLGRVLGIELIKTPIFIYILFKMLWRKKKNSIKEKFDYFRYTVKISIPQIFNHISHTIMGQCDRLIINFYLGLSEVGIYSIAYTFGTIIEMIHNSIENVWRSWFFDKLRNNQIKTIKRISFVYVLLFSIMAISFTLFIDIVFKLFISSVYWEGLSFIVPIMLGVYFLFMASFYISVEYYTKQNKIIAFATTLIAIINLIGNLLFIPIFGYSVAAYTTLISYVFLYIFHYIVVVIIQKESIYNDKEMMLVSIYTVIICFMASLIHNLFFKFLIGFIFIIPLGYYVLKILKEYKEGSYDE